MHQPYDYVSIPGAFCCSSVKSVKKSSSGETNSDHQDTADVSAKCVNYRWHFRLPTSSGAVLLILKAAHLNNWLHGLTFLCRSAVRPATLTFKLMYSIIWCVHHCSVGLPFTTTSRLFTAWLLCHSPLLLWSPPAHGDVGWSLLCRCCVHGASGRQLVHNSWVPWMVLYELNLLLLLSAMLFFLSP